MSSEKRKQSIANLEKKKAELFERKFIDYRNKMVEIYDSLEDGNPVKQEIQQFLETEQGDVQFNQK